MMGLEQGLYLLTVAGAVIGGLSIYWAKNPGQQAHMVWGHWLFLAVCLVLGGCALLAALWRAQGLAGLGLCLGLLLVALLWEFPSSVSGIKPAVLDDHR